MRRFILALLLGPLAALALSSPAQARLFTQPELDALVAPIALYPDGLISDILVASTYPDQVEAAARLPKDAQPEESWNQSVKQLLSFPDILQRMVESPQWTRELGEAFLSQEPHVLDTVQSLRRRAQQQGTLKSNDQVTVQQDGSAIVVQPRTEVVYAPYYDPYVVYGPWWWPAYRPVYWSPWVVAPVFVSAGFFYARPVWAHRHVVVAHNVVVNKSVHVHGSSPKYVHHTAVRSQEYHRVPESQRKPIVSSTPQMHRFDDHRGQSQGRPDGQRSYGRPDGNPSSGHGQQRSSQPGQQRGEPMRLRGDAQRGEQRTAMPAAPRFSDSRGQQQPRVASNAPAPRQAPQQAPRASMPQQVPQQPHAAAPQQPRSGGAPSAAPRGEARSAAPSGGEMRTGGGEMRSSGGGNGGASRGGGWSGGGNHGGGGGGGHGGGHGGGGGRGGGRG